MAAGYLHREMPVPPQIGEALGAMEYRRRAYKQIGQAYIDGQNVSSAIKQLFTEVDRCDKIIEKLRELVTS